MAELSHAAATAPRLGQLLAELEGQAAGLTDDQRTVVRPGETRLQSCDEAAGGICRRKSDPGQPRVSRLGAGQGGGRFQALCAGAREKPRTGPPRSRLPGLCGSALRSHDRQPRSRPDGGGDRLPCLRSSSASSVPLLSAAIAASPVWAKENAAAANRAAFPIEGQQARFCAKSPLLTRLRLPARPDRHRRAASGYFLLRHGERHCAHDHALSRRTNRLDSLFGAIHETGHGLYSQGLPAADLGTALGTAAGMAVHESQSRLWENQVARGRGFWRHFEPRFRALFPVPDGGGDPPTNSTWRSTPVT